uniref:ATP-binding cassette transporter n=1 Tax=Solanum tuberosum TaxID=4113 RepID=M1DNV9_SOLTU
MISEDTEDAQTTSTEKEDSNSEPYSITSDMLLSQYLQEMKAQSTTEDKLVLLKGVSGAFRPGVLADLLGIFVEEVMHLVELGPLRLALVSFPGVNDLLTEQLERLTIAVELEPNPSIIFMNEPTSGLDARTTVCTVRQHFVGKKKIIKKKSEQKESKRDKKLLQTSLNLIN